MYALLRPLLFRLPPEAAHGLTLGGLRWAHRLGLVRRAPVSRPVTVMGLEFPNRIGLAAGLDKNGRCIDGLAALGFGFVEVGTVTPLPQAGNDRPRLFRLPEARALINRMGFNNDGLEALVAHVQRSRYRGVLGINVGKNRDTPPEQAVEDYLVGMRRVYPLASYIAINLSSPNTPGLRDLQFGEPCRRLLMALKEEQERLTRQHHRRVPLAIKIAPDMAEEDLASLAGMLVEHELDAVIATNTTVDRTGVAGLRHGDEAGGLSGAPLTHRSTATIRQLATLLQGRVPIIGVGGICAPADALAKIEAGASLVQLYTGLIYEGPSLVRRCARATG